MLKNLKNISNKIIMNGLIRSAKQKEKIVNLIIRRLETQGPNGVEVQHGLNKAVALES